MYKNKKKFIKFMAFIMPVLFLLNNIFMVYAEHIELNTITSHEINIDAENFDSIKIINKNNVKGYDSIESITIDNNISNIIVPGTLKYHYNSNLGTNQEFLYTQTFNVAEGETIYYTFITFQLISGYTINDIVVLTNGLNANKFLETDKVKCQIADESNFSASNLTYTLSLAPSVTTSTTASTSSTTSSTTTTVTTTTTTTTVPTTTTTTTTTQPITDYNIFMQPYIYNGNYSISNVFGGMPNYTYDIAAGGYIDLEFFPDDDYELSSLLINNVEKISEVVDNQYSFIPTSDTIINMNFTYSLDYYNLTWSPSVGGNISVEENESSPYTYYKNSGTVTITLNPEEGYSVSAFFINGSNKFSQLVNNTYTYTPNSNATISATFTGASITTTTEESITEETDTSITDVTTSSSATNISSLDTGTQISSSEIVTTTQNLDPINFNIVVNGGGIVNASCSNIVDGVATFIPGEEVTLTIIPNDKTKALSSITKNNLTVMLEISSENTYTFTPNLNDTIEVTFSDSIYIVDDYYGYRIWSHAISRMNEEDSDYVLEILDDVVETELIKTPIVHNLIIKSGKKSGEDVVPITINSPNLSFTLNSNVIFENVKFNNNLSILLREYNFTINELDPLIHSITATSTNAKLIVNTDLVLNGNILGEPTIELNANLSLKGTGTINNLIFNKNEVIFTHENTVSTQKITVNTGSGTINSNIYTLRIKDIDTTLTDAATPLNINVRQYDRGSLINLIPLLYVTGEIKLNANKNVKINVFTKNDEEYKIENLAQLSIQTIIVRGVNSDISPYLSIGNKPEDTSKNYSFYKDGINLKIGVKYIELFADQNSEGLKSIGNYIRFQDAITNINSLTSPTDITIEISGDVPNYGLLSLPNYPITIKGKTGEETLNFTGHITLKSDLTLKNIKINNNLSSGVAVNLSNKNLVVDENVTAIFNTINDSTKIVSPNVRLSSLTIKNGENLEFKKTIKNIETINIYGDTFINSSVLNIGTLNIAENTKLYLKLGATVNNLTYKNGSKILLYNYKNKAYKPILIKNSISNLNGQDKLLINVVDASYNLTNVYQRSLIVKLTKNSTIKANSFYTESQNFKANLDDNSLITTKSGTSILITSKSIELNGIKENSTSDFQKFVTIHEAIDHINNNSDYSYTINIFNNVSSSIVMELPQNITEIKSETFPQEDMLYKVYFSKDITVKSSELKLKNINLSFGSSMNPILNSKLSIYCDNANLNAKTAIIDTLDMDNSSKARFISRGNVKNIIFKNGSEVSGNISS